MAGRAIVSTVAIAAILAHYYVRLGLLKQTTVVILAGKWVWVECQTRPFTATLEEVNTDGITVSVGAPLPTGLPCNHLGVTSQGGNRYFLPFRTVFGLEVDGRRMWSNPYSM
jgi:hypothetical protein